MAPLRKTGADTVIFKKERKKPFLNNGSPAAAVAKPDMFNLLHRVWPSLLSIQPHDVILPSNEDREIN